MVTAYLSQKKWNDDTLSILWSYLDITLLFSSYVYLIFYSLSCFLTPNKDITSLLEGVSLCASFLFFSVFTFNNLVIPRMGFL